MHGKPHKRQEEQKLSWSVFNLSRFFGKVHFHLSLAKSIRASRSFTGSTCVHTEAANKRAIVNTTIASYLEREVVACLEEPEMPHSSARSELRLFRKMYAWSYHLL
eukprot:2495469-Amphidinium_carterae.1